MPDRLPVGAYSRRACPAERRNSARLKLFGTAEVVTGDQDQFGAELRNVSFAGCYLATQHPIAANDRLLLRLDIGGIVMQLRGTVSRRENSGFGVKFDPPSFC